jgi:hypothetical protein
VSAIPVRPETVVVVDNRTRRRLICALFVIVFVVHALSYAYFFVDDEAIPFVYAQNVLEGHGLVYNQDDGPVEGYSDFVSVWSVGGVELVSARDDTLCAHHCDPHWGAP